MYKEKNVKLQPLSKRIQVKETTIKSKNSTGVYEN